MNDNGKLPPEDNDDITDENADVGGEEDKRGFIASFLSSRVMLIVGIAALLVPIVMLVLAVFFGSTVFDKAAVVWTCLAVTQFAYWLRMNRRPLHLVLAVVYGVLTLAFVALYVLELTGILP